MAALPSLLTVAQLRELPERPGVLYELHHGEVVAVTRPKARHSKVQLRLQELLASRLGAFGKVAVEWPYRPVPEFELRAADVAAISHLRWKAIDPDDNLRGAPDLMIEVKSPSNTRRQLQELVTLCLSHGATQCWIVDSETESVTVAKTDGSVTLYQQGESIPLSAFGAPDVAGLAVSDIFAD